MFNKRLINSTEVYSMLKTCYSSDDNLLNKYHKESGKGLDSCVNKTLKDLIDNNVKIYYVTNDNDEFIGYFGDLSNNNEKWLTGFFIMKDKRNIENKNNFWNLITNHFKNDFKVGVMLKNDPARGFLRKRCKSLGFANSSDGLGEVFYYMKESK